MARCQPRFTEHDVKQLNAPLTMLKMHKTAGSTAATMAAHRCIALEQFGRNASETVAAETCSCNQLKISHAVTLPAYRHFGRCAAAGVR